MQIQIVVTRDGQVRILARQGAFGEGREKIEGIIRDLRAAGVEFESVGEVESHRHSHEEEHVHDHLHIH